MRKPDLSASDGKYAVTVQLSTPWDDDIIGVGLLGRLLCYTWATCASTFLIVLRATHMLPCRNISKSSLTSGAARYTYMRRIFRLVRKLYAEFRYYDITMCNREMIPLDAFTHGHGSESGHMSN